MRRQNILTIGSITACVFMAFRGGVTIAADMLPQDQSESTAILTIGQKTCYDTVGDTTFYAQTMSDHSMSSVVQDEIITLDQKKLDALKKLNKIKRLPFNWNGNEAEPISAEVIKQAGSLLLRLSVTPEVFPTASGSIQMEYDKSDGAYLEFNVFSDKVERYQEDAAGQEISDELPVSAERLNQVVEDFYG